MDTACGSPAGCMQIQEPLDVQDPMATQHVWATSDPSHDHTNSHPVQPPLAATSISHSAHGSMQPMQAHAGGHSSMQPANPKHHGLDSTNGLQQNAVLQGGGHAATLHSSLVGAPPAGNHGQARGGASSPGVNSSAAQPAASLKHYAQADWVQAPQQQQQAAQAPYTIPPGVASAAGLQAQSTSQQAASAAAAMVAAAASNAALTGGKSSSGGVSASGRPHGVSASGNNSRPMQAPPALAAALLSGLPEAVAPPPQPRRALTKPSDGVKNEGYDNENCDLVLYTGDTLLNHNPVQGIMRKYTIQNMLGQGTFGQVVSCWSDEMQRMVAVKVIKNQPAYFHQARVEIGLLHLLNTRCDPHDERHIVRMLDSFLFRKHLCIVFEKLDVNLFELLKRNAFKGLSLPTVQSLLRQLLDALTVLRDANIMHCDLKPENILLKSMGSDEIKLIDFGSACFENRVVYSYIQSRFYRSPEVVLGTSYNVAIDMWSLGCVAAELFLGLPLFPGASEHDLMVRIVDTLGLPPAWLLAEAKHTERYFKRVSMLPPGASPLPLHSPSLLASSLTNSGGLGPYDLASSVSRHQHQHLAQLAQRQGLGALTGTPGTHLGSSIGGLGGSSVGTSTWVLMSQAEFEARNSCKAPAGKRYFMHTQLADIIAAYPMRPGLQDEEVQAERLAREAFIDFLLGVLDLDPRTRWTPRQAAAHPFITGAQFTGPFQPPPDSRVPMAIPGATQPHAIPSKAMANDAGACQQGTPRTSMTAVPVIAGAAGGLTANMPAGTIAQASLPGSFQTSFIMGTPHKRAAITHNSPSLARQPQPQPQLLPPGPLPSQAGVSGHTPGSSGVRSTNRSWHGGSSSGQLAQHAQALGMPGQPPRQPHQPQMLQTGWSQNTTGASGPATAQQYQQYQQLKAQQMSGGGQLDQAAMAQAALMGAGSDAAQAAAAAAARAFALAALQQMPPQALLGSSVGQGLSGVNLAPYLQQTQAAALQQVGQQVPQQQQTGFPLGDVHMHTDQPSVTTPQQALRQSGTNINNQQGGTQALASMILGSNPSTPIPPAPGIMLNQQSSFSRGTNSSMTNAAANQQLGAQYPLLNMGNVGLNPMLLQQVQGLSHADVQNVANMAAMAAVRQAAAQLQQQQQQQGLQGLGLTPQQLMYLRQQQQQAQQGYGVTPSGSSGGAAGFGAGLGGWSQAPTAGGGSAAFGAVSGSAWQQQQQQQQLNQYSRGAGGISMQGQQQDPSVMVMQQQAALLGAGYQAASSSHAGQHHVSGSMLDDGQATPTPYSNTDRPYSSNSGAQGGAAAGNASPSDWDPGYCDGDLEDGSAMSPQPSGGGAGGGSGDRGVGARGSGRHGAQRGQHEGRRTSSRASSGQDGAVVGRGMSSTGGGAGSGRLQAGDGYGSGMDGAASQLLASLQQQQQQGPSVSLLQGMQWQGMPGAPQAGVSGLMEGITGDGQNSQTGLSSSGWQYGNQQPYAGGLQGFNQGQLQMLKALMFSQQQQQQQQQQSVSQPGNDPFVVGSMPFSGMGAAPAMHMHQLLLQQQQQQQQQLDGNNMLSDVPPYN